MASLFEIWIDGRRVETADARVSVLDRGFLYGDSVFETLRTYDKSLFAVDEHLQRLAQSAERVFIQLPAPVSELKRQLLHAVSVSSFCECYVRVMVTRGQGALGLDPRQATAPLLVVIIAELSAPPQADYENGIAVVTYQASRIADHTAAAGAKLGNYLVAVLGQKKAAEVGAKEALLVTQDGEVLEGATSNVFWLTGNTLWTVPVEAGILAGITRAHILAVARDTGWTIEQRIPQLSELLRSEAVFISSSIRELVSVVRIDGEQVGTGRVSPRVQALHSAFRARVRARPLA